MLRDRITLAMALTGVVLLAACQDGQDATGPSPDGLDLGPQVNVLVGAPGQEELVRAVPGFGGLFIDEDGVPTVYVTSPADAPAAEGKVRGFLVRHGLAAASRVRVRKGDYTLVQLDAWFQRTSPEAFGVDGTVFVDLDERSSRVTIGVEDAAAAEEARLLAKRLGVPDAAVRIVVAEPIQRMVGLRDLVRPVVGGVQINFPGYLCTLAFNALVTSGKGKRQNTQNSFITASHCTLIPGGTEGTPYYQPLTPDFIGTEVDDPRYKGGRRRCYRGFVCRSSDASRAEYADGVPFSLGEIARTSGPNNGSVAIAGSFNIVGERDPLVGETVNKIGRTTGWTQGTVEATCVDTGIGGTNIIQLCQSWVDAGGAVLVGGGDSGSATFQLADGNNNITLSGILWGGNGTGTLFVFSPITNIEDELGELTTF